MTTHEPSNDMETKGGCQSMISHDNDPVVICGMAMRLPGGVSNSEQLWESLLQKRCGSIPIPHSRFNVKGYYSQHQRPGTMHFENAYILDHVDLDRFDTCHFPFNRNEVEQMDPAQRMLLEITWECLENAGEVNWQGKAVGCYVGSFAEDWATEMERDAQYFDQYPAGKWDFMLSNRISYVYDFRGPSMTIKTGCSGTLVALNLAEQAVKSGECSSAIIAGCSLFLSGPIATKGSFGTVGATVSPQGICKTFDAGCDGLGRGEAVNAIYVKKLSHALRDGNPIRAVIRSTATQHDGYGSGMLIPNGNAQESLIRHTYDIAGIKDFSKTAFFECHGTGTIVGDPIEVAAVERIFGKHGILIGSAKPNFGHSEGAAALTSIIKATVMLERETIVPNANFEKPNPNISWADGRIKVATKVQPFPEDRCKRISVNAFGMGGTNTHVILEAYEDKDCHSETTSSEGSRLLLFSASNPKSIELLQQAYMQYIREKSPNLADLAYTLGTRRSKMTYRSFIIAHSEAQIAEPESCGSVVKPKTRQVVFVFNGQGTHWATMGKALVETNPTFLKCIRRLDTALRQLLPRHLGPSWTIEAELVKDETQSRFDDSEYAQTCCTAVQIGITDVLRSWSVLPEAVIGHSSGEMAAAYAAGALTAEAAIIAAYFRGTATKLTATAKRKGTMAAIMLSSEKVANYLVDGVVVACENSQSRTTISGDQAAVEAIVGKVKADGILAKTLNVGFAYHSPHMLPCGPKYEKAIRPFMQSTATAAQVPFFSSVTGARIADSTVLADAKYWHQSLVQPVRFHSALSSLLESLGPNAHPVIVEIGARPALEGPIKQILDDFPDMTATWVPTLEPKSSDGSLLRVAGRLFCEHVSMDYKALTPPGKTLADVPPYTWAHDESFTAEHRLMKAYQESEFPMHCLLGRRVFETSALEPAWRKVLNIQDVPWLADHVIDGLCIFPFTGYLSIAEEALRQVQPGGVLESFEARDFVVTAPLRLDSGKPVEIHTRLRRLGDGDATSYSVQITSWKENVWTEQCHTLVRAGPFPHRPLKGIKRSVFPRVLSPKFWYDAVQRRGYTYGPTFRGIDNISASPSEMAATARVYPSNDDPVGHYLIHPSATDRCMQMMGIAYCHGLPRHAKYGYRPTSVRHVIIHRHESNTSFWTTGTAEASTLSGKLSGKVYAYTDDGQELMTMIGIEATPTAHVKPTDEMPLLSTVKWHDSATFYPFHKLEGTSEERLATAMGVLTHTNPQLRILEIGTGSDTKTTERLLEYLRPSKGIQMFSRYKYAGMSLDGCEKAEGSLGDVDGLEVESWTSVAKDPANIQDYDVIISNNASQCLTEKFEEYLTTVKTLLRPTGAGVLILFEMLQNDEGVAFDIVSEPGECRLLSSLRHAGFDLSWKNDGDELMSPLIVRSLLPDVPQLMHIIEPKEKYAIVEQFKSDLSTTSITFQETAMDNIPPGKDPLVFFLDLAGPYPYNLANSPEAFRVFMGFIELLLKSQRPLIWVTSPCHQGDCKDARYAMIHGFARTLHHEVKDDITVVEVDTKAGDPKFVSQALLRILKNLPHRRFGDVFEPPDAEIAIDQGGALKVPRMQWTTTQRELSRCSSQRAGQKSFAKLTLRKPQDVSSLEWVNYPLPDAVGSEEVRIEVHAASVSKYDLNLAKGTVDTRFLCLGQEGAGIVQEVGSGVQDLKIGDRVAFLANGAIASHLDIASANCLRLADNTPFEDAASIPLACVTAYLCVVEFGKIEKGATVILPFVKSLAWLATVTQLQSIKATLYFIIKSPSHRSLLENGLQIPASFILSDGDLENSALSKVRADYIIAFGGYEPYTSLLRCLSLSGTFLNVLSESNHLVNDATPLLQSNQAYRLVQVHQLLQAEPQLIAKALHKSQGCKPPAASGKGSSKNTFEAEHYREALQATNFDFGHAVLRLPSEKTRRELPMSGSATGLRFRSDASYILVGGLGGLGRTVATWMVEKGARELIFLSRSAGETPDTSAFLGELRSQGCVVKTVAGSVVNREDISRTIGATKRPIAGVFQMSMVLGDRALSKMTLDHWVESIASKVDGTLRLHEALSDHKLDFFVMFSSLSGIVGQIGQLSYNAANTFLDGFAHYRHGLGLAASVVDIGVMGDVGIAARMDDTIRKAEADGCCILNEQDLLDALEVSILHSGPQGSSNTEEDKTQIALGLWSKRPIMDPSTHVLWKRDARMSRAYTYKSQRHVSKDSPQEDGLEAIVRIARTDPIQLRRRTTVDLITKVLINVLSESLARPGIELRPGTMLDELGLDSLNTSQLRDWITQYLFVDLPFHEIIRSETVRELADKVSELMDAEFVVGRRHGNR
ncbi:KR domain-containing protein [Colletotrichum somersetense]|nr:KR domain-containing protein [Colletotrichum somersetense]